MFPGDIRLGTMETGTGLVRAMIHIMNCAKTSKIHVINMSYGEPVHFSNSGYVSCITCILLHIFNIADVNVNKEFWVEVIKILFLVH